MDKGTQIKHVLCTLIITLIFVADSIAQIVDGGNGHAIVLDSLGQVWTIGRNDYGQLGDGSLINSNIPIKVKNLKSIQAISRGYDHSIALDSSGHLYLWGRNNYGQLGCSDVYDHSTPQKLQNHDHFIAIEGGHWHTLGLKDDGLVWAWGHNYFGELGNGSREHS